MKIKELKELKHEELVKRLAKLEKEYGELLFELRTGQETNYAMKKSKKREIARIKTLIKSPVVEEKKEDIAEEKEPKKEKKIEKEEKSETKKEKK